MAQDSFGQQGQGGYDDQNQDQNQGGFGGQQGQGQSGQGGYDDQNQNQGNY
jgi:hypothetical protein